MVGQARNAGAVRTTTLVTYLLPQGAPLSTPVTAPGLPATGAGGAAPGADRPWLLAVALGLAALVGAGAVARRQRRATSPLPRGPRAAGGAGR